VGLAGGRTTTWVSNLQHPPAIIPGLIGNNFQRVFRIKIPKNGKMHSQKNMGLYLSVGLVLPSATDSPMTGGPPIMMTGPHRLKTVIPD